MKAINVHMKVNILLRIMNNKNQNIQFISLELVYFLMKYV